MRGELGEVLGCRMREDHALAGEAGEADVRQRRQRFAAVAHALDRPQGGLQADAVVRSDRGDVEVGERARCVLRRNAAERLRVLVERQQADDRQRGDRAHRPDRREQLVQLVERLDHEEVDAAALQDPGLLGEDRVAVLRRTSERADRARR